MNRTLHLNFLKNVRSCFRCCSRSNRIESCTQVHSSSKRRIERKSEEFQFSCLHVSHSLHHNCDDDDLKARVCALSFDCFVGWKWEDKKNENVKCLINNLKFDYGGIVAQTIQFTCVCLRKRNKNELFVKKWNENDLLE